VNASAPSSPRTPRDRERLNKALLVFIQMFGGDLLGIDRYYLGSPFTGILKGVGVGLSLWTILFYHDLFLPLMILLLVGIDYLIILANCLSDSPNINVFEMEATFDPRSVHVANLIAIFGFFTRLCSVWDIKKQLCSVWLQAVRDPFDGRTGANLLGQPGGLRRSLGDPILLPAPHRYILRKINSHYFEVSGQDSTPGLQSPILQGTTDAVPQSQHSVCSICMDDQHRLDCALGPCGHAFCEYCVQQLPKTECPVCKVAVTSVVKIANEIEPNVFSGQSLRFGP